MALGYAVAQLVQELRYKPEGRGFSFRWCHWNVSVTYKPSSHTMALGLTQPITEMSCRCLGLTILPPSRADCLEIWEPQSPGTLRVCSGL